MSHFGFAQSNTCFMTEMLTSKDNQPVNKVIQEIDKHGNVLSKETIQYFDGTGVSSKVLFQYNAQRKPTKTEYYFKNQLTRTINKQFDQSGNLLSEYESSKGQINVRSIKVDNKLEQVFLNADGTISAKNVSEINPTSQVITKYNAQNNITSLEQKIISTSGKVVENRFEDYLGKVKKKEKFQYNSRNDLIRKEDYLNDVLESYTVYDYSENLLTKLTAFTKKGTEDYRIEYKYTGVNQIEILSYYRNDLTGRISKDYDINGNCIKETSYTRNDKIINETTYKYLCNQ